MNYKREYDIKIDTFRWHELYIRWFMVLVGWKGYTSGLRKTIYFIGVPTRKLVKHERKHEEQFSQIGIVTYHTKWLLYFIRGLWKTRNFQKAYLNIPFEVEAREAEDIK